VSETITAPEAAKRLGVAATTLKDWAARLGVGRRNSYGTWVYTDGEFHVLQTVQMLRQEDMGFDTISRRLRVTMGNATTRPNDNERRPSDDTAGPPTSSPDEIRAVMVEVLRDNNDLGERYARVAHQVGKLENEVAYLRDQLAESQRLLTSNTTEIADLRRLLAESNQALARTEGERDQLRAFVSRPWWRRLLG
jgi:DNA-binding transcriptional MerR regulator